MKTNRRTLRTVCLDALLLLIALSALFRLDSPRAYDGWILVGALIAVYVFTVPREIPAASSAVVSVQPSSVYPGTWRRQFAWILAISSLAASLGALIVFPQPGRGDWGWTLYLLAIFLLVAGVASLESFGRHRANQSGLRAGSLRGRSHWAILALLLIGAGAVRIWQNGSLPPELWYDEARLGVVARQILTEPSYRPFFIEYMDRPAQHAMLTALSFAVFGASVSSLRLVLALFGLLNSLMAYLLFGRWLGRFGGLIAAAVVFSMRYELTFSRIAFDANLTPFFIMLSLYFLDRAFVRRREATSRPRGHDSGGEPQSRRREATSRPRADRTVPPRWDDGGGESQPRRNLLDFTLAGLTIGLGLAFYAPLRLFTLFLLSLGLLACAVVLMRNRSTTPLQALALPMLCLLFGFLTAAAPLIEFAATSPDVYFGRNQSVSILNPSQRTDPDLALAVRDTTLKHLGMFNYQGDRNARHNLPYAPMLDPLSGLLFLLGVGLAVQGIRTPPNFLMLALFAVMLQAGIWSTQWDAPSAVRSIGVLPSLVYFIALALGTLHDDAARWLAAWHARRPAKGGPVMAYPGLNVLPGFSLVVVLLLIALLNLDTYFNRQATDLAIWMTHSHDDTWIAGEMNRLGASYDIVLAADLSASPTIEFLAPGVTPIRMWQYGDHLPLEPRGTRPVAMMLNSPMASTVAEARRIYPAAIITEFRLAGADEPIAYEILLDP